MNDTRLYVAVTSREAANMKAHTLKKFINIAALICFTCSIGCGIKTDDYSETDQNYPIAQDVVSDESEVGERPEVQLGQENISNLNCLIVFEYNNDIWLIDDDSIAVNLTNTGDVFSFTCDRAVPGLILFSVLTEALDLDVFVFSIEESLEPEYIGSVINETGSMGYFGYRTDRKRAPMDVEGNELKIECAYLQDWYDFSEFTVIDLSAIRGEAETSETHQDITAEDSNIQIINEKVGDIYELFCSNQSETYQLTNTGSITRYEPGYPINFRLSPSGGKVLFTVTAGFGETAYGPLLIVNIDGTNQQQLHHDIQFSDMNCEWEWVGDKLLYIGYSVEDGVYCLFLVDSNDNIPEHVVDDVSHFDVIYRDE